MLGFFREEGSSVSGLQRSCLLSNSSYDLQEVHDFEPFTGGRLWTKDSDKENGERDSMYEDGINGAISA